MLSVDYFTKPGKNRPMALFFMTKVFSTLPFNCVERDCLALKWLKPGARVFKRPLFVTLTRLVNDLFVFIRALIYSKSGVKSQEIKF